MNKTPNQAGFTLIELMVVVVIVSVLLASAVLSLKPNESATLRQQTIAFKGALIAMCDQATFDQHIYALVPKKDGIEFFKLVNKQWQVADFFRNTDALQWNENIKISWQLSEQLAKQYGLESAGWLCWPSGEVKAGKIAFELGETINQLSWNEILEFELTEKALN